MERPRVLPDVNVCFPISLLDLVLRLDEAELHQVVWTEDLLDELARVWVEHGARSAETAGKVCDDIRAAFVGQDVARHEYEDLIDSMPGSDSDDHAHAAAAVARAPCVLLTKNTKDFPAEILAVRGVAVREPDDYLTALFDQHPDELVDVVREMAADRRNPPMTANDIIDALGSAGVPDFAARVRRRLSR
ncbi:MAG: PIN domain-containing protein [Acidimicrobiales bacterium]